MRQQQRRQNQDILARNRRICYKTSRKNLARALVIADRLDLSRSGAVHYCMAAFGHLFHQDTEKGTAHLMLLLDDSDRDELRRHLDMPPPGEVPW